MHMICKGQCTGPPNQPCPQRSSSTALLLENVANETAFLGHTPLTRQKPPGSKNDEADSLLKDLEGVRFSA